jgi:exonuclease VII small subunit
MVLKAKPKKKPAKKEPTVASLLKRVASLERKFNAHDVELGSHVEQLDKHQRTLESMTAVQAVKAVPETDSRWY